MSHNFELKAEHRTQQGTADSRRLRRQGKVPAIIYGAAQTPESIMMVEKDVKKALENEAFYSHLLTLHVDGKPQTVVLKALQRHPVKPRLQHLDFLRVSSEHKITVQVPIRFVNEDTAPGVKMGGNISHLLTDVKISCLPKDLPEHLVADLGKLQIGQSIHLSELPVPEGVILTALTQGASHDLPVVSIYARKGTTSSELQSDADDGTEATPTQ